MPLHITSTTKSVRYIQPTTKDELRSIIEQELEHQGPDADLNFIDTSKITDMYELFYKLNIRNIKIDKWDVSNVTDMVDMFLDCKEFNCDLRSWDVKNVEDVSHMLTGCSKFNSCIPLDLCNKMNLALKFV